MSEIKRVVSTSFWEDEKVVNLFTPEDRYFMLYLLTNPHTTQLGIYRLVPRVAGFEMGYSTEAVTALIDRFQNKYGILRYSKETSEVAIKNYLKYSIMKGGKPVYDCLIKEFEQVKDQSLIKYIYNNNINNSNITIQEFITYIENIINDNENERIVDDSGTIRQSTQKACKIKGFQPPTYDEVLDYCRDKSLTFVDPGAFIDFYESKNWYVGKNKMSSWHSAVSGWNRREKEKPHAKPFVAPNANNSQSTQYKKTRWY